MELFRRSQKGQLYRVDIQEPLFLDGLNSPVSWGEPFLQWKHVLDLYSLKHDLNAIQIIAPLFAVYHMCDGKYTTYSVYSADESAESSKIGNGYKLFRFGVFLTTGPEV